MREIKFRAWDKLEQCFINIKSFGFFEDGEIWYVQATDENENDIDPPYFLDEDRLEIIQFTGIYDKNGNEIYEGDILKHPIGNNAEITYIDDLAAFVASYKIIGKNEMDYLDSEIMKMCEVIGNIYEHPHLL